MDATSEVEACVPWVQTFSVQKFAVSNFSIFALNNWRVSRLEVEWIEAMTRRLHKLNKSCTCIYLCLHSTESRWRYDRLTSSHKSTNFYVCTTLRFNNDPHAGNVYTKRLNTRSLKLVLNYLCVAVTWSRNCHKYVVSDAPKTERWYGIVEFNVPLNTVQVIKQNEAAFFATYEFIRLDGGAENDGHEIAGHEIDRRENAGHEIAGHEIARHLELCT